MGVYDIVTPDNLTQSFPWREGRNFSTIVKPNVLFFWTGADEDSDDGITVDMSGQFVEQIDEDTYILQPSNITIHFVFQSIKITVSGVSILQAVLGGEGGEDESDAKLDELRHFFDRLLVKQIGREVGLVGKLQVSSNLNRGSSGNAKTKTVKHNVPHNVKGLISGFLTGKTGSIGAQTNKLQQNIGTIMAPRSRKGSRRHRRTRRTRRTRKN